MKLSQQYEYKHLHRNGNLRESNFGGSNFHVNRFSNGLHCLRLRVKGDLDMWYVRGQL